MYNRTGNYSLIPDGQIEVCKPYTVAFYHCGGVPTRETLKARKCPFQPGELFITSGNRRIPVFALTWVNTEKKYLHVDHYVELEHNYLSAVK